VAGSIGGVPAVQGVKFRSLVRGGAALLLRRAKLLTAHGPAEEFANGSERHLAFAGPFRRKWVE
jgi:hypothetical protein